MKKTILALAALVSGSTVFAAEAAKNDLAVTLDVTYVSNYVFRGIETADDSIQPSIEASYGDFYAGIWHSDDINSNVVSETDFYAGYNLALNDTFSADLGVTRYTYDGSSTGDTTEVFAGVKANVLLSPSVYYYYDFDREVSTYIGSVGYSVPVANLGISVDLSALIGYVQVPNANNDYTYWGVGAAVPYKLADNATLTAGVSYTTLDRNNYTGSANQAGSVDQDQVVFSVGLAIGF